MSDCCKDNMTSTTVFGDDYEYRIDFCAECGDTSGEIDLQAKVERLEGVIKNILDDVHCGERREDILETYEQAKDEGGSDD